MTYKLVLHESGKYTVEFDDGGCRPATDVEVALFKQRDELIEVLGILAQACEYVGVRGMDTLIAKCKAYAKGEAK